MSYAFFKHDETLYCYDSNRFKLYRIFNNESYEVTDPEIIKLVRLKSAEINYEQAIEMATWSESQS